MLKKICKLSGKYMILYGELDLQSSGLRKNFSWIKTYGTNTGMCIYHISSMMLLKQSSNHTQKQMKMDLAIKGIYK